MHNFPLMNLKYSLLSLSLMTSAISTFAQRMEYTPSPVTGAAWNTPGNLNPFIPGYFADPTIRKFGDTYYIYATTDGTGNGYGPAQVWVSKDFVNWKNVVLNWPTTEVVWAPDVVQQNDGTYRYYYCEPCNINIGESSSPLGPWKNILGTPDAQMVPDRYVHNVITLDPQLFRDDDGAEYLYFTTWGIYDGFGCGVAKLNPDYKGTDKPDARRWNENRPHPIAADDFFSEKKIIPNTELKDIFEAPFVFKRDGIYYFTYSSGSCHTDTYRVQYATSTVGPMGPFEYKGELLTTNTDGTVHGPGHHSILVDGDHYYIVYHRHDIAKAIHGFNRQVCIDELHFNDDGTISKVTPTHDGLIPASLVKKNNKNVAVNLAYGASVTASSYYNDMFKPQYATDDNNATLWKARHCNNYTSSNAQQTEEWICIDLGEVKKFNQVWTQFEYATFFYQYRIEVSADGVNYKLYSDRQNNVNAGSPMIDTGDAEARYIRITITDTQKNGHFPAIWNVKVYNATKKNNPANLLPSTDGMDYSAVEAGYPDLHKKDVQPADRTAAYDRGYNVIDINADDYADAGNSLTQISNKSAMGGTFRSDSPIVVEVKKGKHAFYFDGKQTLRSDFSLPRTMKYNAPYTISAWVLNPQVGGIETVAEFTTRRNDLATIELRQGTDRQNGLIAHNASFENFGCPRQCKEGEGKWQHWTVTYDGYMERIYLDGKLVTEKNSFLMIRPEGNITLGSSFDGANRFSGYLHSLKFYDRPLTASEVEAEYQQPSSTTARQDFSQSLTLKAQAVTPSLVRLSVTDADGNALRTGILSYSYSVSSDKKAAPQYSTPSGASETLISTDGRPQLYCSVRITDDDGNIVQTLSAKVNASASQYTHISEQYDSQPDGALRLSSAGSNLGERSADNGAMHLVTVTGDFVLQTKIADIMGSDKRSTPAYNEGGIIVLDDTNPDRQRIVHLGIFPAYDCGNMLTVVGDRGRLQYPNRKGWNFDRYMQIERKGDYLYARTSTDGVQWTDIDGSPVHMPDFAGRQLKVGLYQTTYSANEAWVSFDSMDVYQRR